LTLTSVNNRSILRYPHSKQVVNHIQHAVMAQFADLSMSYPHT